MNQYNEISTLQYMGSKARIISHICDPIIKNESIETVVDLFAGTGSVGYALKSYKSVISNDIEYYAYIINQAILNGCSFSEADEAIFWMAVEQQYVLLQGKVSTALSAEKSFFDDEVDYKLYQSFCEKTPSVFETQSDDFRMEDLADLVSHVTPGDKPTLDLPCLFLTYFATVKISVTTVTSAEEVLETTAIPSTAVWTETVTEAVVAVTTVTAPQTETPKVEAETPEFYETTEPTEIITESIVITDDTKLTHKQFSTEENMQRLTSELNVHYEKTGMTLDPTLNKHNTGWMFTYQGEIDKTAVRSYNEHWDRIVVGMDEQIEAFMTMSGATYTDLRFYYYAELQPNNEYHVYFCYQ